MLTCECTFPATPSCKSELYREAELSQMTDSIMGLGSRIDAVGDVLVFSIYNCDSHET